MIDTVEADEIVMKTPGPRLTRRALIRAVSVGALLASVPVAVQAAPFRDASRSPAATNLGLPMVLPADQTSGSRSAAPAQSVPAKAAPQMPSADDPGPKWVKLKPESLANW